MRMLTYPELKSMKGIPYSRVHIRRLRLAGAFPQAVKLGGNTLAWVEAEIDDWLEEKAAERRRTSTADSGPAGDAT